MGVKIWKEQQQRCVTRTREKESASDQRTLFTQRERRDSQVGKEKTNLPSSIKLIISNKVGVVALERVQDESLVRLRDGGIGEPPLVGEVELGRDGSGSESGGLGVHLHVNGFGGLDSDDELVSGWWGEEGVGRMKR